MIPAAVETFTCEKYHCTLTRQACADRTAARVVLVANRPQVAYPGCQNCEQGRTETKGLTSNVQPHCPIYRNKTKTQEDLQMTYPRKIDHEKLKRLAAAGKFVDEIAKECGVAETSIRVRAKKLGLTLNLRRKPAGVAAQPSAPASPTYNFPPPALLAEREDRIIPVTLRLTVEVNVRVSTESINAA